MARTLGGRIARASPASRKLLRTKAARKSAPNPRHEQSVDNEDELAVSSLAASDTEGQAGDDTTPPAIRLDDMRPAALREHLEHALDFINNHVDPALHPAGTLRPLLCSRPGYARSLAAKIHGRMRMDYAVLREAQRNFEEAEVTSDDFSSNMSCFIPEIDALSRLPDVLGPSYDLALKLGSYSYGEMDVRHGCGFGDRPSDEPCDSLLVRLIHKRVAQGQVWDWQGDLQSLDRESEHLSDYGIEPWLPRTRALLRSKLGLPTDPSL